MYKIKVNGQQWDVALSENTELEHSQESDQQFFRKKLVGSIVVRGAQARSIMDAPYGTEWSVEIYTETGTGDRLDATGVFTHTDCELIDYDDNVVKVKIQSTDIYDKIEKEKGKEISLLEELAL